MPGLFSKVQLVTDEIEYRALCPHGTAVVRWVGTRSWSAHDLSYEVVCEPQCDCLAET